MTEQIKYEPRPVDITWAQEMVARIKGGGILAYPATKCVYRVNHLTKTLTLTNPEITVEEFDSFVIHEQTKVVFDRIGWKVNEAFKVQS